MVVESREGMGNYYQLGSCFGLTLSTDEETRLCIRNLSKVTWLGSGDAPIRTIANDGEDNNYTG